MTFKPYWLNIAHPEIEIMSGINHSSINKDFFSTEFNPVTTIGAKFGFFYNKDLEQNQNLSKFSKILIYFENNSSDWLNLSERENYSIDGNGFKFGIGKISGYGYKIGSNSYIILYQGGTMSWSETSYSGILQNKIDSTYMKMIGDDNRTGNSMECGVKAIFNKHFFITGAFEKTSIYPRYMFWYRNISEVLHAVAQSGLNHLNIYIFNENSIYFPILNFVTKSALSFGFYELKRKQMNWPFKTVSPIIDDGFRIGVSYVL
jgi:hypothetical protein